MESCLAQVLQKDVGKRLQVGQELIDYFSDKQKSADLEHDQTMLDKLVDGLATSWVNSSNYKVSCFRRHSCRWLGCLGGSELVLRKKTPLGAISRWLPVRHSGCDFWMFHSGASRVFFNSWWRSKNPYAFAL